MSSASGNRQCCLDGKFAVIARIQRVLGQAVRLMLNWARIER
jgi:hypothetical protein